MYKWSVQSALGRARPGAPDMVRVAEGIAASLRSFSISASRAADEAKPFTISRTGGPSRTERSASAVKSISSLPSTPSRGIDARSLAARPTGGFTITRVDMGGRSAGAGGFSGASRGGGVFRGREGFRGRGAFGDSRGRGRARGKGRGRGKDGRAPPRTREEMDEEKKRQKKRDQLSPEQDLAWRRGMTPREYVPRTTLDSLLPHIPAIATKANINLTRSVVNSLQVMTGDTQLHTLGPEERIDMINKGKGTMMWDKEEKDEFEKYVAAKRAKHPDNARYIFKPVPKEQTDAILEAVVAGKHAIPQAPQSSDILGLVDSYALRNETYLPEHSETLKAKLRTLLPATAAAKAKPSPAKQAS
ncbi:hypothetical protein PVAG01_06304 [Phlyctema vagabunda]|uniref:Uncharacterized protein n=1 Tax=Phlyctema vagabunda TaxID=108571 RepID=A0ABR4PFP1_9HELO